MGDLYRNSTLLNTLMTTKRGSAGGQARAITQHQAAIDRYYKNPKLCLYCTNPIQLKLHERIADTKKKTFCTRSCAAFYQNSWRIAKQPNPKPIALQGLTKDDLFSKRKNYQSARSAIRQNAFNIFMAANQHPSCEVCQYNKHVEVAHRAGVSSFTSTALISEINALDNLVGLCRNCHWEFDHGLLKLGSGA